MPVIIRDKIAHFKIANEKVIQRSFKGKEFTKSEIKRLTKQFQDKYRDKNLTLMIGVDTPFGYRNSKQFNINDEPSTVDDYEWETTGYFYIYGWKSKIESETNVLYSCC
jgi:hypothetical protein